jgi:hypothetical protein
MQMDPKKILTQFDHFLAANDAQFSGVVIGGSALVLTGTINRKTEDVDILSPAIPQEILKLAEAFRKDLKKRGVELIDNWLNNGPDQLLNALPKDWKKRTTVIFNGKALQLSTLGRMELLKSKLWAYCDRQDTDRDDLLKMKPTKEELLDNLPWVQEQDGNPDWPAYVDNRFRRLAKDLGYEL